MSKNPNQSDRPQRREYVSLGAILAALAGTPIALAQEGQPQNPVEQAFRNPMQSGTQGTGGASIKPTEGANVQMTDDQLIVDLHVNDEDLGKVLEMLSIQSQVNILAGKDVSARVTANLYGVTFYEALDALLKANGFAWMQEGNFIYVYTREEYDAIRQAQRVQVSKVFTLNYLTGVDAAEWVKPLLSEGGQIKTNGKTERFPALGDVPVGGDDFAGETTMVVFDYEENVAEIEKLLGEIDTRPTQVLIEATILQTSLNEANAFGVDFSLIADMNFIDFTGGPLSAVNNMISGAVPTDGKGMSGVSTAGGTSSGRSTFKFGIVEKDVSVFVRLLDEVADTTIISNPKIFTLNRQPARVLVGRKVGYLQTTSTDTSSTQSVEFLDTGTQLNVRPFVADDGLITLELRPSVSEAIIRESTDATGGTVTIPDEITNELTTRVMVRDGQTVVLGGLFRESTETTRRQVPLLGDIPIIGQAFRGHDDEVDRNEIIFLITPSRISDQAIEAAGDRGMSSTERARVGARKGLLFFSRERRTGQHMMNAQKKAAEGKNDKAMWHLRRALYLRPQQPDARDMWEGLSGKVNRWPSRNLLERVIGGEAAAKTGASAQPPSFNATFNPSSTNNQPQSFHEQPAPATWHPTPSPAPVEEPAYTEVPADTQSFVEPAPVDEGFAPIPPATTPGATFTSAPTFTPTFTPNPTPAAAQAQGVHFAGGFFNRAWMIFKAQGLNQNNAAFSHVEEAPANSDK